VIGTGQTHSIRELCSVAFSHLGLNWQDYVVVDPALIRPADVELLIADPSKAHRLLGWKPAVSFNELIHMITDSDFDLLRKGPVGRDSIPR